MRMKPRNDGGQSLRDFNIRIDPTPAGFAHELDVEGNLVTRAWFEGMHPELLVETHSLVQCIRENPFDYLLNAKTHRLPLQYEQTTAWLLRAAREHGEGAEIEPEVVALGEKFCTAANSQLLPFLDKLNAYINENFQYVHREEGTAWSAAQTMASGEGACRDFAVLFQAVCQSLGIATRFVSGYQEGDSQSDEHHLHAWAEVYVPGAGWRGYDPTLGLAVANGHVALAASALSQQTLPLSGTFRGTGISTQMHAEVQLSVLDEQQQLQQQQ